MNTLGKMGAGAVLLLALAPGTLRPAQAQLHRFSEREEVSLGYAEAMKLERAYGVMPADHPMSRRVRAIGAQFARLARRRHLPYTYKVLLVDRGINAATYPGGFIYIFRGAVNAASNDAELAYVIGHETAHADRRHSMTAIEKAHKRAMLADLAAAVLARKRSPRTRVLMGVAALELQKAASARHSRKDEDDADRYAVRWMSQLGYDPRAASAMLGKFPIKPRRDPYEESHPDPRERQRSVQRLIAAQGLLATAQRAGGRAAPVRRAIPSAGLPQHRALPPGERPDAPRLRLRSAAPAAEGRGRSRRADGAGAGVRALGRRRHRLQQRRDAALYAARQRRAGVSHGFPARLPQWPRHHDARRDLDVWQRGIRALRGAGASLQRAIPRRQEAGRCWSGGRTARPRCRRHPRLRTRSRVLDAQGLEEEDVVTKIPLVWPLTRSAPARERICSASIFFSFL